MHTMRLYEKTTTERTERGQGGDAYLKTVFTVEDERGEHVQIGIVLLTHNGDTVRVLSDVPACATIKGRAKTKPKTVPT